MSGALDYYGNATHPPLPHLAPPLPSPFDLPVPRSVPIGVQLPVHHFLKIGLTLGCSMDHVARPPASRRKALRTFMERTAPGSAVNA